MASTDDQDREYAAVVGERLRAIRTQRQLSLREVADSSDGEFKWSVLGAYERGSRSISVPRLRRLAELYGVPVDQLLPEASGALSAASGRMSLRSVRLDLAMLGQTQGLEADALRRFVERLRIERQDFQGRVITLRGDDIRVLGAGLGFSEDQIVRRMYELNLLVLPPAAKKAAKPIKAAARPKSSASKARTAPDDLGRSDLTSR